jgi:hypothetical protein
MSSTSWIDPRDEQELYKTAQNINLQNSRLDLSADENVGKRAASIYRDSPWLPPGVVLGLAKSNASPQAIEFASNASARSLPAKVDTSRPKKKNWFQNNVYDKLKTGMRWSFAGMNLVPDLAQNVASQVFNPNDPEGFDGWFASTQLGTMMDNSKQSGEGFFLGEKIIETQGERARNVRGQINGNAWTIGRGTADVFFAPGTKPYSILSGFVDAAVLVGADPTTYVGGQIKQARSARAVLPSADLALAKKVVAAERSMAGLSEAEQIAWNGSKFMQFATKDRRAQRLVDEIMESKDSHYILSDLFDYRIDPDTAVAFKNAKTREEVLGILGENASRLDAENVGLLPTDIRDIPGATWTKPVKERLPGYNSWRNSRFFAEMPSAQLAIDGSGVDRANAIKNIENWLRTINVDPTSHKGRNLLNYATEAYSHADGDTQSVLKTKVLFERIVATTLREEGVSKAVIRDLFSKSRAETQKIRAFFVDEAGRLTDEGFVQRLLDMNLIDPKSISNLSPEQIKQLRLQGPASIVEMLDRTIMLPDVRTVRRLTSNPFFKKALSTKEGNPRAAIAATEYLQNNIWKPLNLATGGYIVRNMLDAQVRIATHGMSGAFNHPLDFMAYVLHSAERIPGRFRKGIGTIRGSTFDELEMFDPNLVGEDLLGGMDTFVEAMNYGLTRNLDDPAQVMAGQVRTGNFPLVNRLENPEPWREGMKNELRQLSYSPEIMLAARGHTPQEIYKIMSSTPDGQRRLRGLIDGYLKRGFRANAGEESGRVTLKATGTDEELFVAWIEDLTLPRIGLKTGGDETLNAVVAYNRVPVGDSFTIDALAGDFEVVAGPLKGRKGSLLRFSDGTEGIVMDVVDDAGVKRFRIQQLSDDNAFPSRGMTKDQAISTSERLGTIIDDAGGRVELPETVKIPQKVAIEQGLLRGVEKQVLEQKNKAVDFFFGNIAGGISKKLERSVVWRQSYYPAVADNADLLDPAQAKRLVEDINSFAKRERISPERYVGGKEIYKKIKAAADRSFAPGETIPTGTIDQLDDYAQAIALRTTKESLYDGVERNNLEDVMRIIAPFGAAWREVVGTYTKFLIEDPTRIRRVQRVFNGLSNADPDADGQGFFYKDPQSGEYVFNFPFSGELSKLLTGINAPLQAPVKRLSVGLSVIPSLGPVGQIAASKIIPDTPTFDTLTEVLLPYGKDRKTSVLPQWADKLRSALTDSPGKLNTIYANTYVETLRALSASGDYDMSIPQESERLMDDARWKARILTSMRAFSQFLGPTSASPEFIIPTDEGDVYVSALTKEFQKLQSENYDTAIQKFLATYGDDALLYISSKTQALKGGLDASEQFGVWERQNKEMFDMYPDVAGYFAPTGDDFSYSVWERQIRTEGRKRLTGREIIAQAQYRIGAAKYRAAKDQVGQYPTEEERAWLKNIRQDLNRQHPGFPAQPVFEVGKFESELVQLSNAASDPSQSNNPVSAAVIEYLSARDKALQQAAAAGYTSLGSKAAQPLRDWLASMATTLILETPEFARVYERVLSSEVEQ